MRWPARSGCLIAVSPVRRVRVLLLASFLVAAGAASLAASASAASVAYIDNGEVWLATLDGSQRVLLATPYVTGAGETEPYVDVAQSDGGRIVAVRNVAGRISRYSTFRVWEPDGTSTVQGPLNAPSGYSTYAYPLGFDVTADGKFLVYGYSNAGFCCPQSFDRGTYVRAASGGVSDPVVLGDVAPTTVGNRVVAVQDSSSRTVVDVQALDAGNPFNAQFTPFLDTAAVGLELSAVDVAATGTLAALGFQAYAGPTQTTGKVAVLSIQGLDQSPAFPATVDCFLPASGVAGDPSLAPDGASIAWKDSGGVKVAGSPVTSADPCELSRSPVVISPTGRFPSIGGARVSAFLPPTAPTAPGSGPPSAAVPAKVTAPGSGPPPGAVPAKPTDSTADAVRSPALLLPGRLTARQLTAKAGLTVTVRVPRAGLVSVGATVPASRLGRRGAPVAVATGRARATRAGTVKVRLRATASARRGLKRLRGTRVTLRTTQGARTTVTTTVLR